MIARIRGYLERRFLRWLVAKLQDTPYRYGQCEIRCGKGVSLANVILNARSGRILIGNNVIFGHNAMLLTGYHDTRVLDRFRPTIDDADRDIEVGDNVWIASGAIVIGPVKIGEGSVIGAGSVVTRDIPARVLAAGIPAKVIRSLEEPRR